MSDAQKIEATDGAVSATLAGRPISIPPVRNWRSSAADALAEGRIGAWAESVLSDEDYDTYVDVDPTIGEVEDMFASASGDLGMTQGESRASRRSSRRTANR